MAAAPAELVDAIKDGDVAAVRERLRAQPALASARDADGQSLVLLALFNRQRDVADAILDHAPELDALDAAALGRADLLRELLAADPERLRARTPEGFTAIGLAAFLGGPDVVRVLLDRGADPDDDADNPLRVRPVHAAAAARDLESMRLLLDAGADPNARQQAGFTPLHAAAHVDDEELARLLLAHGADPALRTDDGRDAAAVAAGDGSERVAALLAA
jgi:uncharacterized protein